MANTALKQEIFSFDAGVLIFAHNIFTGVQLREFSDTGKETSIYTFSLPYKSPCNSCK
jgi:hypothetical protein